MDAAILKQFQLFATLDPAQLEPLASQSRIVQLGAGAWLFHEGDAADAVPGILRGRIKVVKTGASGKEAILEVFGPGDTFAEVAALDEKSFPASACTMEPSEVVMINAAAFRGLIREDNSAAYKVIRELTALLRSMTHRIQALQTERVEPRLASLLLQLAKRLGQPGDNGVQLPGRWTRQDLADLVGATQETVIRILSRWQKAGWVISGSTIEILNEEKLAEVRDALDD